MNWTSGKSTDVSKDKIWRGHIVKERSSLEVAGGFVYPPARRPKTTSLRQQHPVLASSIVFGSASPRDWANTTSKLMLSSPVGLRPSYEKTPYAGESKMSPKKTDRRYSILNGQY
mmetsp:Transcript_22995/g.58318  ORF Transcript_22995/g.58318 Transcript_22995/m.58318 type:complete len:115 (-) Transcript_22995:807-1151(-)